MKLYEMKDILDKIFGDKFEYTILNFGEMDDNGFKLKIDYCYLPFNNKMKSVEPSAFRIISGDNTLIDNINVELVWSPNHFNNIKDEYYKYYFNTMVKIFLALYGKINSLFICFDENCYFEHEESFISNKLRRI